MGKKISNRVIIDAYKRGLIPSALYSPDANNMPQMQDLGLPKLSPGITEDFTDYLNSFSSIRSFIKSADNFRTVFTSKGNFNSHSEVAESYAISLAMEEKYDASIAMFEAITAGTKTIDTIVRSNNKILPVVNRVGLLGFEGIFQYANACYEVGSRDDSDESKSLLKKSKNLYQFIADLYTGYHGGPRFCEVKKESLNMLVSVFNMEGYKLLLALSPTIAN